AFGDRRIEHAVLAVLALQALGDAEHAAEVADILTHRHDARVPPHHHVHGGVERLDHVHLRHLVFFSALFFSSARSAASCWRCFARCGVSSLKMSSNIVSGSSCGPSVSVPYVMASRHASLTCSSHCL